MTVPRKAKEAAGAITQLTHNTTGQTVTINVEYNQLDPLLRATGVPNKLLLTELNLKIYHAHTHRDANAGHADGDVNSADGFSAFPGNMNELVFNLASYHKALSHTGGLISEFVNPKYADASRTTFKSPCRLECMMQDMVKVIYN
jgi:UDP-sugar pyrophosphorylase